MREPGAAGCYESGYRAGGVARRAGLWVLGSGAAPGGRWLIPCSHPASPVAPGTFSVPGYSTRRCPCSWGCSECSWGPRSWVRAAGWLFPRSHRLPAVRSPRSRSGRQRCWRSRGFRRWVHVVFCVGRTFRGDLSMVLGHSQQHHSGAPLSLGDGCPSLLHLPLSVRRPSQLGAGVPRLPRLGRRHGKKPHTTATRPATGKLDQLGWVLGTGMKQCSTRDSIALASLLWARVIPTGQGAVTQRNS